MAHLRDSGFLPFLILHLYNEDISTRIGKFLLKF